MATYVYDDFRVTLTPRADGTYDVRAVDDAGVETVGTFRLPLTDDDLARAGGAVDAGGKQVAQLVPFLDGSHQHAPAWSSGSTLY